MKTITLEEHYLDPAIARAGAANAAPLSPDFAATYDPRRGLSYSPSPAVLLDVGEARLEDMTRNHIDLQVLSCLSTQLLPPEVALPLTRRANDSLAETVRAHPDRFAGFAAVPTTVPEAAPDELERCIRELGFVGTLIMGRTEGDFLDAPRFDPLLARASELGVPIYLHPAPPPVAVSAENYAGLDPLVTARFQTSAWGWHTETAVHFLHLVLSGVLDRYPNLQFILGHWGEMIPFYLDRLDEALPREITNLERTIGEYVRQNVYLTPSGMFSQAQLQFCADTLGTERILFSVDYPFIGNEGATPFLDGAALPTAAVEAISHGNAERLLGL